MNNQWKKGEQINPADPAQAPGQLISAVIFNLALISC